MELFLLFKYRLIIFVSHIQVQINRLTQLVELFQIVRFFALLKIKIGDIEFGILPLSNFLEVSQNLFVLINVNDCNPRLLSSVLGESLMLVNDGEDNLSEGDSCLEFHVFYSILEL